MSQQQRIVIEGRELSEAELAWAKDNIEAVRRRFNRNNQLYSVLFSTFIAGVIVYFFADGLQTGAIQLPPGWRTDLFYDLTHNLGIWLCASVVTVLLLEVGVEYSKRKGEQYLNLIESILKQDGVAVPTQPNQPDDKLDAILQKLDRLDQLEAEIAALRARLEAGTTS